jgi:cell division transport system permease protein
MNKYSIRYTARQSILSLFRNVWLAVLTAGMIAISLAILGGFLLVATNVNQFIHNIESNVEISVFLHNDVNTQDVAQRLDNLEGVQSHTFVSKEEGLEEFSRTLGDRTLLSGLEGDENPLPDMFRVRVVEPEMVAGLAAVIGAYPEVEMADYGEELVTRLVQVTGWLNSLFLVLSVLLASGAVFLVVTIIRLSVMARQDEVGIMKYLGASNWFIRFPFLLEGMVMGWAGTIAAVLALGLVYFQVAAALQRDAFTLLMQPVTDMARLLPIFVGLIVLGTVMGGVGSFVSIRKYLRV